jgi:hypothetical protein
MAATEYDCPGADMYCPAAEIASIVQPGKNLYFRAVGGEEFWVSPVDDSVFDVCGPVIPL